MASKPQLYGNTKSLLILDVNGVFCYRHKGDNIEKDTKLDVSWDEYREQMKEYRTRLFGGQPESSLKTSRQEYDFEMSPHFIKGNVVFFRPGCLSFLKWCIRKYKVGIFTSMIEKNCKPILEYLSKKVHINPLFIWCRDRTKLDPDYITSDKSHQEITSYDTIKALEDILQSPIINRYRNFHDGNTLMIDDSPRKMKCNHEKNYIIIDSFDSPSLKYKFNESSEKLITQVDTIDIEKNIDEATITEDETMNKDEIIDGKCKIELGVFLDLRVEIKKKFENLLK